MDRYVFCKNVKVLFNEKKVIIGNALTGHWIKISKECYDIIQEGIQKKMCVEADSYTHLTLPTTSRV